MADTSQLHICRPETVWLRSVAYCPVCKRRRRFVGLAAAWYDTIWTCCGCGDSWCGEEGRMERPFRRGWREESTRRARKAWAEAAPKAEADAAITALVREAVEF